MRLTLTRKTRDNFFALTLILPSLVVIFFVIIYPLVDAFVTSFFRYFLTDARGMSFIGLANYAYMLSSRPFWTAFLNTIVYVAGTVGGEFVFAFALALLVNFRFKLKNALNSLYFVPWIMPSVVVAFITRFLMFDQYNGVVNILLGHLHLIGEFVPWLKDPQLAMPTVIISTIWKMFPFMFVVLYAGLQVIPEEEVEAAKIDGANGFQRFLHVTLPNMREIITLATILEFIWQFQYLTIIWVTTKGGPIDRTTTLPILIYEHSFKGSMNMGYGSTVGVFWLLFLFGFSIVYVKFVGKEQR